jgi:uncharacterized protein YaaN involved in tellurite resistance
MFTPEQKLGNCLIDMKSTKTEIRRLVALIHKQENSANRSPKIVEKLTGKLLKEKERLEEYKRTYKQLEESLIDV